MEFMAKKIQIKRGLKSKLPVLSDGEFGLCTNTNEVFIGNGGANVDVTNKSQLEEKQNKVDNTLITTNKTIVGGINELKNEKGDYEYGTWTPRLRCNGEFSVSVGASTYKRIGKHVTCYVKLEVTALPSDKTGNVFISGLPIPINKGKAEMGIVSYYSNTSITDTAVNNMITIEVGATDQFAFGLQRLNDIIYLPAGAVGVSFKVRCEYSYIVA